MRDIETVDLLGSDAGKDKKPMRLGESLSEIPASHGRQVFERIRGRQALPVAAFNSSI